MNRRGIIGGMMVTFVATIIIILILFIFVIGATFIREFDGAASEVRVYSGSEVGLGDVDNYMLNYSKVVSVRYYVGAGMSLADALVESEKMAVAIKEKKEAEYWKELSTKYPDISR